MTIDLTKELAALLKYTGNVAVCIRKYSAYNGGQCQIQPDAKLAQLDLLFLSDCLHNFGILGDAIISGDPERIIAACEYLLGSYSLYQKESPVWGEHQAVHAGTFALHSEQFQLSEAMSAFEAIKAKVAFKCSYVSMQLKPVQAR